jgi:hypothetical protein
MSSEPRGDDSQSFASQYRTAIERARFVSDGIGTWCVYELPPQMYDRRRGPSLVFQQEGAVRRVRDYPADWRALDDGSLLALRENA